MASATITRPAAMRRGMMEDDGAVPAARLDLESRSGLLTFEGRFVRNRLIGTVAIAGVAPVGNVEFRWVR